MNEAPYLKDAELQESIRSKIWELFDEHYDLDNEFILNAVRSAVSLIADELN